MKIGPRSNNQAVPAGSPKELGARTMRRQMRCGTRTESITAQLHRIFDDQDASKDSPRSAFELRTNERT